MGGVSHYGHGPYSSGFHGNLAVGHRSGAEHFRAVNAVVDDFDQGGVVGRPCQLGFSQRRPAAADAFRPNTNRLE
jgi:hypothetical protein